MKKTNRKLQRLFLIKKLKKKEKRYLFIKKLCKKEDDKVKKASNKLRFKNRKPFK